MKKEIVVILIFFSVVVSICAQETISINKWTYIEIDSTRETYGEGKYSWLRPFGMDVIDVNEDGYKDILSGWYLYLNPGGDMKEKWERKDLPEKIDGIALVNVDNDHFVDIIGQELPSVYWIEAIDRKLSKWSITKIAEIPKCEDMNSQGHIVADLIPGDKPEILIATIEGVYMIGIPSNPKKNQWIVSKITHSRSDEGIDVGDIDGDGLLDFACGDVPKNDEDHAATLLHWYKNPGTIDGEWMEFMVGMTNYPIDRVKIADVDHDGRPEIIVTEERWNVIEPIAGVYVFNSSDGIEHLWDKKKLASHYSLNSLDVADLNRDGDIDIVVTEHKGPDLKTYAYINDGEGVFSEAEIYEGMEMHLGTKLIDMDNDGDLDIIGPSWDKSGLFNLLRNDAILKH